MRVYHLTLECNDCNLEKISDMNYIKETLLELTEKIEMDILGMGFYNAKPGESPGCTGFIVISTSHIAFHSFTDSKQFFLDVASCKVFNPRTVQDYIKEKFKVKKNNMSFKVR